MGKRRFSSEDYASAATERTTKGESDFAYSERAKSTGRYELHESLNIAGKMRVSRDTDERPLKTPVIVAFNVTGSMAQSPARLQAHLPQLLGLLEYKHYCTDPDICVAAFGDWLAGDHVPLQIGSFEGDNLIDENLRNMILEGGGGDMPESDESILAFAAYRTKHDRSEKRGGKGYLFILTDTPCHEHVAAHEYNAYFKPEQPLQSNVPLQTVLDDARKLYEVFVVITPTGLGSPMTEAFWKRYIPQGHLLKLQDETQVSGLIAATIGMMEGSVDWTDVKGDLTALGSSSVDINTIEKSVSVISAKPAGAITTGLPDTSKKPTIKRLGG